MQIETLMSWDDVLADRSLHDLPYKIELSARGQIVMSPAGNRHGLLQGQLVVELTARAGGTAWVEGSIRCSDGSVRVADVVWMSDARKAVHGMPDPMTVAPEICVEVRSPGNSAAEIRDKVRLYLEAGAEEVWVVTLDGVRTVHKA